MSDLRNLIYKQQERIQELEQKLRKTQAENIEYLSSKEVYERSLRENQDLLRALFDDAGYGMMLLDLQGYVIRINRLTSLITGYRTDEILGKSFLDFIKNYSSRKSKNVFESILNSKKVAQKFYRKFYRKDGNPIWLQLNTVVQNDISGRPQAIFVLIEDTTQKKQSDKLKSILYQIARFSNQSQSLNQLLQFIKKEMQKIFNSTNIFLELYDYVLADFKTDVSTGIIKRTPLYKTLEGYVYRTKCAQILTNKEIEFLSSRNEITIDGNMPHLWIGIPLIVSDNVIGLIGIQDYEQVNKFNIKDIDIIDFLSGQISFFIERQKFQERLNIEEKLFRNIFENSPEAIALIDKESVIKRINKGFTSLFGYDSGQIIDLPLSTLIENESDLDQFNMIAFNALNNLPTKIETFAKGANDEKKQVLIKTGSITDLKDFAFVLFEDISQQKNYETQLKSAKRKAEESDNLKSAFLTNLTSEIRTPLNAIVGFSNLLSTQKDITPEDKKVYSESIERSSNNLVNLINNLIDISLIDSNQFHFENEIFNPVTVLETACNIFEAKIEDLYKDSMTLKLDIRCPESVKIYGDKERFLQAINHLIDNAIKFSGKGEIIIGIEEIDENLRFFIKDQGIGIEEKNHEIIFQRFIKISPDEHRIFKGTGLGLYITQAIINNFGGRVEVLSEPMKGSEFFFLLHKAYAGQFDTKEPIVEDDNFTLAGKTILIVEDITSNFKYLQAVLLKYKPQIIWAKTGLQAIRHLEQETPIDLILMDLQLPDINGLEVAYRYKRQNKNLPIIAQTAYPFNEARENIYSIGCDEYLTKPINPKILLNCIKRLFNNKKGV